MFYVVSYDISDPKRLYRVAKTMEDFGARVQYSVFECHLEDADMERLQRRLHGVMVPAKDSVRFYAICGADLPKIKVMGKGSVTKIEAFRMI